MSMNWNIGWAPPRSNAFLQSVHGRAWVVTLNQIDLVGGPTPAQSVCGPRYKADVAIRDWCGIPISILD